MTRQRLSDIMRMLGWSTRKMALLLGVRETTARLWKNGENELPLELESWLEMIVAPIEANPYPENWRAQRSE